MKWPSGLRRGSTASRFQRLQVSFPSGVWISLSRERCLLSGSGLYDRPISLLEESYCVCVCVCVCASLSVVRCNNNPLRLQ